jgi:hypothetical protein
MSIHSNESLSSGPGSSAVVSQVWVDTCSWDTRVTCTVTGLVAGPSTSVPGRAPTSGWRLWNIDRSQDNAGGF